MPTFDPFGYRTLSQAVAALSQDMAELRTAVNTIVSNQEIEMATEAQIQAAADGLVAGITTLQNDVTQLTAADTALDTAVTNLTDYIKNNPGTSIPDSLLSELTGAQTAAAAIHASVSSTSTDLTKQAGTLSSVVPSVTLTSLVVTPSDPTESMASGTTLQFTATGTMSDGTTQDLTGSTTWASDTPAIATIAASGIATLVATGTTTISATSGGVTGSTILTVTA